MNKLSRMQRILAMREASRVERAHTIVHHGTYSNGQHSFDMLTLALELRPETSANMMRAIIYHDLGERWVGDMPHPAKGESPEHAAKGQELEEVIASRLGWQFKLTTAEKRWIRALDRLEFLLWADDQVNLGNRHLEAVLERAHQWFEHNRGETPERILDFLKTYRWQRTPDVFPS